MSNPYFKFKRFTVFHDKCAMKVGTDGVLLGAWVDVSEARRVLDVGAGSGLIALMLAQRCGDDVEIDAIDIDEDAVLQTKDNVSKSDFNKINGMCISLQDYVKRVGEERYDLIVSNPPYFSSSLHSPDKQRTLARHTNSLEMKELLDCSSKILSERGRLCVVYPSVEKDALLTLSENAGLHVTKVVNVYPAKNSSSKRILVEFAKQGTGKIETDLIIEKERHVYSGQFVELVKDFYLKL